MTSDTPDQIAGRMKEAAERATPGEWTMIAEDLRGGRYYCIGRPRVDSRDPEYAESIDLHEKDNGEADATHIAASSPANVLSLIEDRQQLKRELAALKTTLRLPPTWLLKAAERHCDWVAFKHALSAVMNEIDNRHNQEAKTDEAKSANA